MNKNAVLGLLIALLLPLTGYFIIKGMTTRTVQVPRHYIPDSVINRTVDGKAVTDTIWHQIPDFSLTNQLGKQVSWSDIGNKIVVADFFFTKCPTICPALTMNMKRLQDGITSGKRVGNQRADFVHYLSFSVDPERDSVSRIKAWADRFGINPEQWWLLTGNKKQIYDLSINHMKLAAIDGEGVDTGFIHTDFMVLIDKRRNIRGYYHGLDSADLHRLSRDIIFLSLEKDPGRKKFWEGKLELIAIVFGLTVGGIFVLMHFLKKEK
jgi:protein SCO1/2